MRVSHRMFFCRIADSEGLFWVMVLVTSNKEKQVLFVSYIGRVRPEELARAVEDSKTLLDELRPGFISLVDLTNLEAMELDCAPGLGRMMESIDQRGVGMVVRVIPDPTKDIGINILTLFHYTHRPKIVTSKNMTDAATYLVL